MRSGLLRHRVTIEAAVDGLDDSGAPRQTWVPFLPATDPDGQGIAAHVLPADAGQRGGEQFTADQIRATCDTKVRIRYREGVTPKMRVRHHTGAPGSPTLDVLYDIEAVTDADPRKNELWLWCRSRQTDGFRSGTG